MRSMKQGFMPWSTPSHFRRYPGDVADEPVDVHVRMRTGVRGKTQGRAVGREHVEREGGIPREREEVTLAPKRKEAGG